MLEAQGGMLVLAAAQAGCEGQACWELHAGHVLLRSGWGHLSPSVRVAVAIAGVWNNKLKIWREGHQRCTNLQKPRTRRGMHSTTTFLMAERRRRSGRCTKLWRHQWRPERLARCDENVSSCGPHARFCGKAYAQVPEVQVEGLYVQKDMKEFC